MQESHEGTWRLHFSLRRRHRAHAMRMISGELSSSIVSTFSWFSFGSSESDKKFARDANLGFPGFPCTCHWLLPENQHHTNNYLQVLDWTMNGIGSDCLLVINWREIGLYFPTESSNNYQKNAINHTARRQCHQSSSLDATRNRQDYLLWTFFFNIF